MSSSPSNNSNNTNSRLPGWAIAVICIAAFAILFGAIALVYAMMITRRNKKRKTPINPTRSIKKIITKKEGYQDPNGSHAHINGFRSSDSVQMMQSAATSVNTLPKAPSPIFFEHQQKMQLPDDWSNPFADEEERRRKLGESLLQRQLEEDGTSVKHAGRFTRVRSVAELPKSASMVEHPRYP